MTARSSAGRHACPGSTTQRIFLNRFILFTSFRNLQRFIKHPGYALLHRLLDELYASYEEIIIRTTSRFCAAPKYGCWALFLSANLHYKYFSSIDPEIEAIDSESIDIY
jgi:hypothetical protein